MMVTTTLEPDMQLTAEQISQIEEAKKREIVFDDDSPSLTPTMEKAFRLATMNRNRLRYRAI